MSADCRPNVTSRQIDIGPTGCSYRCKLSKQTAYICPSVPAKKLSLEVSDSISNLNSRQLDIEPLNMHKGLHRVHMFFLSTHTAEISC